MELSRRLTHGAVAALTAAALLALAPRATAHDSSITTTTSTTTTQAAQRTAGDGIAPYRGLTAAQRRHLMSIARHSWRFFADDVDPTTHLPLDNLTYAGGSRTPTGRGAYTSSANIGVYLWSLVSASDLGLVSRGRATELTRETLREVATLPAFKGFLYQWYDTGNGHVLQNPGQGSAPPPVARSTTARSSPTSTTAGTPRG